MFYITIIKFDFLSLFITHFGIIDLMFEINYKYLLNQFKNRTAFNTTIIIIFCSWLFVSTYKLFFFEQIKGTKIHRLMTS